GVLPPFHIHQQVVAGLAVDDEVEALERAGPGVRRIARQGALGFVHRNVRNRLGTEVVLEGELVMEAALGQGASRTLERRRRKSRSRPAGPATTHAAWAWPLTRLQIRRGTLGTCWPCDLEDFTRRPMRNRFCTISAA